MEFNIDQVNKLIAKRRSVFSKDYTGERVKTEIINQILENANWAPNHKMTEPWRFVVFTGEGLKKLAEFQGECYKRVTSLSDSFKEERYQALLTKPLLSSHVIAVGVKRDEAKRLPEIEEVGAVYCAIENMYLTATAYGVGCYLSSGGITYFEDAKAFFGLGKDDRLLGFLHVGIPKGEVAEGKRRPIAEKVKWVE